MPRHLPNPKQAFGDRKVPLALVPAAGLIYGAMAMKDGAAKYGPFNWRDHPIELMTYAHAILRHLFAWIDGENVDRKSGVPHIGHVIACCFIMADAIAKKNAIDNRPSPGGAADLLDAFEFDLAA